MKLEYGLLGLLAFRPRSGYDLAKSAESESRFLRATVHHSQIYRVLRRMVADGWVDYEVDPREGRPDAKVYRLTESGRRELLAWVRAPYAPTQLPHDPDFQMRFALTAALDKDAAKAMLRSELACRRDRIARFRNRDRTVVFDDPIPEVDPAAAQGALDRMHDFNAAAVDAWVVWLERTLAALERGSL